ncbi:hypothetical protein P152DRAFT_472199 [Eremomyces bilateralis CBS 781.70]|uniref:Serine-rich protein n=1 Tax=Eremomyces bilateralis CBS 781.70 TaxID=1392243 RepID=A0A6G1G8X1_9PEZI|nr:uncharacterized protein P152DRAFT_472199 [Eremomyces bilateralis CBS 781.70]KAF1814432.1 hypothetical protein P152DRAFT_472199 [Eremomyces bilateralis CBS 781.70]
MLSLRRPSPGPSHSRRASPKRQPLREHSQSRTNELARPSIRIIDEDTAAAYFKSPFPSHPSHILRPHNAPDSIFEDKDVRVSADTSASNVVTTGSPDDGLIPQPLKPRKSPSDRQSTSTSSEAGTFRTTGSPYTPSSSRFSQASTPPSSLATGDEDFLEGVLSNVQEANPSSIRLVASDPLSSSPTPTSHIDHARRLNEQRSGSSLASSATSDALTIRHPEGPHTTVSSSPPSSPNFIVHSTPGKHQRSVSSLSARSSKSASPSSKHSGGTIVKHSAESLGRSDSSSTGNSDRPRSASSPVTPLRSAIRLAVETGVPIQYPIVRQSPASNSWASSSTVSPRVSPRMNDGPSRAQWSSRLSTIPSETESRPSHSFSIPHEKEEGRESGDILDGLYRERSSSPRRWGRPESESSNGGLRSIASESTMPSVAAPAPLFSTQYLSPSSTVPSGRDSEEQDDHVADLPSPQLRQQRSGYFRRYSDTLSRPTSSGSTYSARSSAPSVIASTLPAWARAYYRGSVLLPPTSSHSNVAFPISFPPETSTPPQTVPSTSIIRQTTSASARSTSPSAHFPLSLFHPRKRPRQSNLRGAAATSPTGVSRLSPTPEHPDQSRRSVLRRSKRFSIISRRVRMSSARSSQLPPPSPPRTPSPTLSDLPTDPAVTDTRLASDDPSAVESFAARQSRTARLTALSLRPPQPQYLSGAIPGLSLNSPRLPRDRRSAGRMSVWVTPSLDEPIGPRAVFGGVGRQIALFAVGFVFPPAWYVGALLPLPQRPTARYDESDVEAGGPAAALAGLEGTTAEKAPKRSKQTGKAKVRTDTVGVDDPNAPPTRPSYDADIQQALALRLDAYEEKQFLKARWWRNLNRIMCVVGLLLIGAVIALAVVGTRMRDGRM